jgi:hypothetical protein
LSLQVEQYRKNVSYTCDWETQKIGEKITQKICMNSAKFITIDGHPIKATSFNFVKNAGSLNFAGEYNRHRQLRLQIKRHRSNYSILTWPEFDIRAAL